MKFSFKNKFEDKKNNQGFTLVETLVAIGIFASAVTGLITITAAGISNSNFVKNKFTATYLALEGQELVHNLRDSSTNAGESWSTKLDGCIQNTVAEGRGCMIDPFSADGTGLPLVTLCGGECNFLMYDNNSGQFSYNVSNPNALYSIFRRTILIEPVGLIPGKELLVTSRVDWLQGSRSHSVSYSSYLLNWTGN